MRIADLQEGMSRAGEILAKGRKARSDAQKAITLVRLKKDGAESKMHDAASKHTDLKAAQEYHDRLVKLNPKSTISHNVYADNSLTDTWTGARVISEIKHTVGSTAEKVLQTTAPSGSTQDAMIQKFQKLKAKQQEILNRPDAHTGKYARDLQSIDRQLTRVAREGGLDAFGVPQKTLSEDATSGATASGNVATVAQPMNWISRRVPAVKLVKSERKTPKK
jgi:hypothetical protein